MNKRFAALLLLVGVALS